MNIVIPCSIFIAYAMILYIPDLRISVSEWIILCALITFLLAIGCRGISTGVAAWSPYFIIAMGAVFRGMFLLRPAELSDDIYRYLFDGSMLISGNNPYTTAPLDTLSTHPALSSLATLVNHGDLPTIYPPAAQFVFAAGAMIGGVFGMKLILVMLDILLCAMMAKVLKGLGRPPSWLILYAWHPLPVLEIAGSGHIDGAGMLFLFVAIFFLTVGNVKDKPSGKGYYLSSWAAGFFLACSMLTKWLPLIFSPGLLLIAGPGRSKSFACGFLLGSFAMIGVFFPDIRNGFHTLFVYAANWEFSGFAFRLLRDGFKSGNAARIILATVFMVTAGAVYLRCLRARDACQKEDYQAEKNKQIFVFQALYAVSIAFLMLTPTIYPWYALCLTAFLPFAVGPAGLVLSWSVFLGYRVLIGYAIAGKWVECDLIPALIAAGPAAAFIASSLSSVSILPCRLRN